MEQLIAFITDPANWSGSTGIPTRLIEHLFLCALAVLAAALIGLPIGLSIGHTGRFAGIAINAANIGRAVPSYAVMVMILPVSLALASTPQLARLGLTFIPVFGAMLLLAIPPILVAAYAGVREVDRDLLEAARGMGMSERSVLRGVELPLALPVIVGGFRIAILQVIATATIGALLSGGGLGRFIIDGMARNQPASIYTGVLLVAGLAIGVDLGLVALQRSLTPLGVRIAGGESEVVVA
jgi:osmoprotectant transport system permease protein